MAENETHSRRPVSPGAIGQKLPPLKVAGLTRSLVREGRFAQLSGSLLRASFRPPHFQGPFEAPQLTSEKKPAFGSGDEALGGGKGTVSKEYGRMEDVGEAGGGRLNDPVSAASRGRSHLLGHRGGGDPANGFEFIVRSRHAGDLVPRREPSLSAEQRAFAWHYMNGGAAPANLCKADQHFAPLRRGFFFRESVAALRFSQKETPPGQETGGVRIRETDWQRPPVIRCSDERTSERANGALARPSLRAGKVIFDRSVTAITGRERLWSYFIPARSSGPKPNGRFQMGKTLFGVSVAALIMAFVAGWAIPQSKARVALAATVQVESFKIMVTSGKQMPSEHFADYSFVFN